MALSQPLERGSISAWRLPLELAKTAVEVGEILEPTLVADLHNRLVFQGKKTASMANANLVDVLGHRRSRCLLEIASQ